MQETINDVRVEVWRRCGPHLTDQVARIDGDGSQVGMLGECKDGMRASTRNSYDRWNEPSRASSAQSSRESRRNSSAGIPVVESDAPFHIDVQQRVLLNMDRDNVTPGYRKLLHALVLNHTHGLLTKEAATAAWVADGLGHQEVSDEAIRGVVEKKHGARRAIYDPSDREANNRLVAKNYEIVHGGTYTKDAWENIRRAEAISPSRKISPSPQPYDPNAGKAEEIIDPVNWSEGMRDVAHLTQWLASEVLDLGVAIIMTRAGNNFRACFHDSGSAATWALAPARVCDATVTFNLTVLRSAWFDTWRERRRDVLDLIIHELAHRGGHHLEVGFHDAMSALGARAVELALAHPGLFDQPSAFGAPAGTRCATRAGGSIDVSACTSFAKRSVTAPRTRSSSYPTWLQQPESAPAIEDASHIDAPSGRRCS